MPENSACPDRSKLAQLLDGRTNDDQASQVETHLLSCQSCCQVLKGMEAGDTLIESVRGSTCRELPLDAAVQGMMARLKAVVLPSSAHDETLASQSFSTDDAWGLEKLLDPPQADGELGWFAGYRVLRVLGSGGMGIVFEVQDPHLQRHVALKVMKPVLAAKAEHRQRFLREARSAAAIDHPHIVTVHQVGEHRDIPFLAMQLLKGESLDDRLRREGANKQGSGGPGGAPVQDAEDGALGLGSSVLGASECKPGSEDPRPKTKDPNPKSKIENPKSPLPLDECLRIGRETAEALAVAHERGLIHRDIKPANIWLESPGGWVKLVDFGLAHAVEDEVHLTQTGAILGTPAYMSPEQARGDSVGPRSDLFSLGVVLYRLTTGQTPFQGPNTWAVLTALATATPQAVSELNPEIPPPFAAFVMRLLAKRAEERFESAQAVVEAIRNIEAHLERRKRESEKERQDNVATTGKPPRRHWPWLAAAAGAAAILLAGAVVVVRDKEGREVARISVPEGGSVATEDDQASHPRASTRRKPPGSADSPTAPALPNRSASEAGPQRAASAASHDTNAAGASPKAVVPGLPSTVYRVPVADAEKPFVILRFGGKERKEFKRFTEAIALLRDGDVVEIHGNGPFAVPPVQLQNTALAIRAAAGYRPVLVSSVATNHRGAWFDIQGKPVTLEGCDFMAKGEFYAFAGGGAPWEWRNCRILTSWVTARFSGPLVQISNSVIWSAAAGLELEKGAELKLMNNVIHTLNGPAIPCRSEGEQKLSLRHNTFLSSAGAVIGGLEGQPLSIDIEAEGNLFDLRFAPALLESPLAPDAFRPNIRWQGRQNLYCGPNAPLLTGKDSFKVEGLDGWKDFWKSDEMGPVHAPEVSFTWDSARVLPVFEALAWLRETAERARQNEAKNLPDLGPNWDLIGPGDAYVRALALRGEPVRTEDLRPEPPEEGPFVLVRDRQMIGARATLPAAIGAARSGDTIEIRTDGPFAGANTDIEKFGRKLVIRSAPGYLPVVEGEIRYWHTGDLTLEGIHFNGSVNSGFDPGGSLRLVNCSFAADRSAWLEVVAPMGASIPSEIVNCWDLKPVDLVLDAGAPISIRNSVIGLLHPSILGTGERHVGIERCVLWNPGGVVARANVLHLQRYTFARQPGDPIIIAMQNTLLESAAGVVPNLHVNEDGWRWKNSHNLYRTGNRNLVEQLRTEGASGDEGSLTALPFDFDPLQWRLLPGSPGYQAGPDGKDFGADVTRIATITSAAK